jgi:hypothetical protein
MSMQRTESDHVIFVNQRSSWEWAKLIRKLRWIGLEDEARRLELAVSALPPDKEVVFRPSHPAPTSARQ